MNVLFLPFRETWETDEQKETIRYSASSRYRCDWVARYMPHADVWEKRSTTDTIPDNYDCYIFQKTITPFFLREARRLKEAGKILIFDLCDAEWSRPERADALETIIRTVDYVTCSSEYIRTYVAKTYRKPVRFIPDRMDLFEFSHVKHHEKGSARVAWFGNRNTIASLSMINDALYEAQKRIPFTLVLISDRFDGYRPIETFEPALRPVLEKIPWTIDGANEAILSCDVVVNPHDTTTDIGKAKSDNKTTTAWALGLPVVSHGNTHRMATLLSHYLTDPDSRNRVGAIGRARVEQLFDVRISALEFVDATKEATWISRKN